MNRKRTIVIVIMLFIAGIFVVGADWAGETVNRFFHSYFADIAIPFGFYFLLLLLEDKYKFVKKCYVRAGAVFALCSVSETLQYFGVYALAKVFDPLDYLMYALGVGLGAFVDRVLFKRLLGYWN